MSIDRQTAIVVGVVLLFGSMGVALAATPIPTSGTVPLQTNSGLVVDVQSDLPSVPFADDNTVDIRNIEVNASGSASLDVDTFDKNGFTNVSAVDATSADIRVIRDGASNVTILQDDITAADVTDPTPVQSGDTDLVYSAASDASVRVDTNGNGIIAIDRSSGTALEEASPDAAGFVTVDLPQASSQAVGFEEGPNTLFVRNVSDPQATISPSGDTEIRFFERGSVDVFVRDASNGQVPFAGLPKTSAFVARANLSGYVDRRVLIDSIFAQDEMFLLPDNNQTETVETRFTIEDRTGTFGGGAQLQLSRPINTTASPADQERYVDVAGGIIGDAREFQTTLEKGVRYRVTISEDGDQRQLGSVVAASDRVYNLEITGIEFDTNSSQTVGIIVATGNVSGSGGSKTKTLTLRYNDSERETTSFSATIHEVGDPSNVLTTVSPSRSAFPLGDFKFSTSLSGAQANTSYVANVTYERLGEQKNAVKAFGASRFAVGPVPLGDGWRAIFGVGLLIVMGAAFSVGNARIGALIIPGVAFVLLQIGWLVGTTTVIGVGLSFSVAVLYNVVKTSRGVP
jgi:hypothetical protein